MVMCSASALKVCLKKYVHRSQQIEDGGKRQKELASWDSENNEIRTRKLGYGVIEENYNRKMTSDIIKPKIDNINNNI